VLVPSPSSNSRPARVNHPEGHSTEAHHQINNHFTTQSKWRTDTIVNAYERRKNTKMSYSIFLYSFSWSMVRIELPQFSKPVLRNIA